MRTLALVLATLAANAPPSATPVSVAYAASLTAVVQGPLAQALRSEKRLVLQGEGKGSRALAHLIADGVRTPDAFVTADVSLYPTLRDSRGSMIREAWILGSARLLLGCSKSSPKSAAIDRLARGAPILATLDSAGIRLGRTDPRVDPKGSRTVEAFDLLAKHEGDESAEKRLLANARVFPEEVLLARVEQGELDCAVFYSTEIRPSLRPIDLPRYADLSNKILYGLAILRDAPHPQAAKSFADFVLRGDGRAILERAGVRVEERPLRIAR